MVQPDLLATRFAQKFYDFFLRQLQTFIGRSMITMTQRSLFPRRTHRPTMESSTDRASVFAVTTAVTVHDWRKGNC